MCCSLIGGGAYELLEGTTNGISKEILALGNCGGDTKNAEASVPLGSSPEGTAGGRVKHEVVLSKKLTILAHITNDTNVSVSTHEAMDILEVLLQSMTTRDDVSIVEVAAKHVRRGLGGDVVVFDVGGGSCHLLEGSLDEFLHRYLMIEMIGMTSRIVMMMNTVDGNCVVRGLWEGEG